MSKVLVLTGPTASGKSAVSIKLAQMINGEIINADSMQIYKGCNIGSAKLPINERHGIVHHMIDVLEPYERFSTAEYKISAVECIKNIIARGNEPVITGGTGLYLDALIKNITFSDEKQNQSLRNKIMEQLNNMGPDFLHEKLRKRDPEAAEKVHPNNTRRVIRYLEILEGYKGSLAEYMKRAVSNPSEYDFKIFILWPKREFIYKRIEDRVEDMIAKGLVDEVKDLIKSGVKKNDQCMMGIGYKETYNYIYGLINYTDYVESLKINTRRYAKRQFTWLKRYIDAEFIPMEEDSDLNTIAEKIYKLFTKDI